MNENARWMPMFPGYKVGEYADMTYYLHFCGSLVRISLVPDANPFSKHHISGFIERADLKRCLAGVGAAMLEGGVPGYGTIIKHALGTGGRRTYASEDKLYIPGTLRDNLLEVIKRYENGERLVYRGPFGATIGFDKYGDRRESYPNHSLLLPGWNECGEESRYGELFLCPQGDAGWKLEMKVVTAIRRKDELNATRQTELHTITLNREDLRFLSPQDAERHASACGLTEPSRAREIASRCGAFTSDVLQIFEEHIQPQAIIRFEGGKLHHPDISSLRLIVPCSQARHMDIDVCGWPTHGIKSVLLLPLVGELAQLKSRGELPLVGEELAQLKSRGKLPLMIYGVDKISYEAGMTIYALFWGNE